MTDSTDRPIVVGISRRTGSPEAARWAVEEARLRGTWVLAVTAWHPPRPPAAPAGRPPGMPAKSRDDSFEAERKRMADLLAAVIGDPLDTVGVRYELREGSPASVLLAAAKDAQLLVLDSPRSGSLSAVPKSWIAESVVFRSGSPVVVMPRAAEAPGH